MSTETPAPEAPPEPTTDAPAERGYDADAKSKARTREPITIGGVVYLPVKQTTDVMRTVRSIGREQEKLGRQQRRKLIEANKLAEQAEGVEADRLRTAAAAEGVTAERRLELERQADEIESSLTPELVAELEGKADALEAEADKIADKQTQTTFKMLSVLLRDDGGQHPAVKTLEAELELADAEGLARHLVREERSDPTPPTATTTT